MKSLLFLFSLIFISTGAYADKSREPDKSKVMKVKIEQMKKEYPNTPKYFD